MRNHHRIGICIVASLLGACTGQGSPGESLEGGPFNDVDNTQVETLDELVDRTAVPGAEERYLIEGDMLVSYEVLERYHASRQLKEKAIVSIVKDPATGNRWYATRNSVWGAHALNIRYCYTDGWGGTEASLSSVKDAIDLAAAAWEGVAGVRFVYVSDSDGDAKCTQANVGNTIDFVIKPNKGVPNKAYAWFAYGPAQELAVGLNTNYAAIMMHELGHVLGFDHEFYHDGSGLTGAGCLAAGTAPTYDPPINGFVWENQHDVTAYDNGSIMGYYTAGTAGCQGLTPQGMKLSRLDGVGGRIVYGNPDFWTPLFASAVL